MISENLRQNLKDSLFTGIIATAIFLPIVGLRTELNQEKTGLEIIPEWNITLLLILFCVVGRFIINLRKQSKSNVIANTFSQLGNYFANKGKIFVFSGL